ncbi:uncharacterized protein LOC142228878 [Haematobia irritans]|uniref:uncharacterized protein LOC142228878 n=1 Tax=Haematobia irritans TaxID=7368 RepID=UPI003F4F6ADB
MSAVEVNTDEAQQEDGDKELKQILKTINCCAAFPYLKDAKINSSNLIYLQNEDIKEAIPVLGLRIEFREKLYKWRNEQVHHDEVPMPIAGPQAKDVHKKNCDFRGKQILNRSLADILCENAIGTAIIQYERKYQSLTKDYRDELINIIANEAVSNDIKIRINEFTLLLDEIVWVLPSEESVKDYYFIPRDGKENPSGKLYSKYKNRRAKRLKCDKSAAKFEEAEMDMDIREIPEVDENVATSIKTSLNRGSLDWEEVTEQWKKTFLLRRSELLKLSHTEFLSSWTKFAHAKAADLNVHGNSNTNTHTQIQNDSSTFNLNLPNYSISVPNKENVFQKESKIVSFSLDEIKTKVIELSLKLYDLNSVPRNLVLEIQSSVSSIISSAASIISSFIPEEKLKNELKSVLDFCKNPFQDISTEYKTIKLLKSLELYEDSKLVVIDEKITEVVQNGNPTLGPKKLEIVVMPLKFMIKSIFSIPNLLNLTLQNIQTSLSDDKLSSFANGDLFKKVVQQYPSRIQIPYILYFDDFQINNALGGNTYSVCGCYMQFPLIPKHLLSQLQFIFTAAFVSTKNLKECGNESSFHSFVEDLKQLELGIDLIVNGSVQKVHFILGLVVGDNLAVNSIVGYVQSFNAMHYCRACTRLKTQMQSDNREVSANLRSEFNYEIDLSKNNTTKTGIKESCVFADLNHFSVTNNYTFDLMHDLYEGVCAYDVCNILIALINNNILSLNTINSRKELFAYGEIEIGNISKPLEMDKLNSCNLKMSASEAAAFAHFLPLLIGDLVPVNNQYWGLLLLLLDIIEILLRPNYTHEDLQQLKSVISDHHILYKKLFGSLKPKHHFLVHYATSIQKCGPLKYLWCMRFEAKHKEAKIYCHNIPSRRNPPQTLAIKAGLKFSKFLVDHKNGLEPFLTCHSFVSKADANKYFEEIHFKPEIFFTEFEVCNDLTYKGTRYKSTYYLGIHSTNFELYKIIYLIIKDIENVFILCKEISIKSFDKHFRAYEVGSVKEQIQMKNINEFNTFPMHLYPINNGKVYARPKHVY